MQLIKRGCLIAVLSLIISTLNIPAYSETWEKTYGGGGTDQGRSVQQTTDGGYIIAGWTNSIGAGNYDVYIIKTDNIGNQVWAKAFGGIGSDMAHKIKQTSDGGYIIVGETESFGQGKEYTPDVWLIKIDSSGNKQWDQTFGGNEEDVGYDVEQTFDGGYIIVGGSYSFANGRRVYVIRTQANGNLMWQKTFDLGGINHNGYASCIQKTKDGLYAIAADIYTSWFNGYYTIEKNYTYFLLTDNDGANISDWDVGEHRVGSAVRQTIDGAYVISGLESGAPLLFKSWGNGNDIWSKIYPGEMDVDAGTGLQIDLDGGFILTSISRENFTRRTILIKTDSSGNLLWQKFLSDVGDWIGSNITASGGSIVVGSKYNQQSTSTDVYLIYYSPDPPINAKNPNPANNSSGICTNPISGWVSDATASGFDVYFGTNSNLTSKDFKANQSGTTFYTGSLNKNATYYWRIDSKNDFGTNTGEVWSFTTGEKPCTKAMPWLQLLLE
jgi:hypothetical protein